MSDYHYLSDAQFEQMNNAGMISGSGIVKSIPKTPKREPKPKTNNTGMLTAIGIAAVVAYWLVRRINPGWGPGWRAVQYGQPWNPVDSPTELHYTFMPVQDPDYPKQLSVTT